MPADAPAALNRPGPGRPLTHRGEHRGEPGSVGAVPASAHDGLICSHDLNRG